MPPNYAAFEALHSTFSKEQFANFQRVLEMMQPSKEHRAAMVIFEEHAKAAKAFASALETPKFSKAIAAALEAPKFSQIIAAALTMPRLTDAQAHSARIAAQIRMAMSPPLPTFIPPAPIKPRQITLNDALRVQELLDEHLDREQAEIDKANAGKPRIGFRD